MSKRTRREFLEQSVFTATAAAVGASQLRTVQAQDSDNKSANDTIRVAVVGVNGRGGSHISGFKGLPNVQVAAICDCDEAVGKRKVEALEKAKGVDYKVKFYQDIRKLLEDDSIDAVSIATPNHWHALAAIWAIQAGKDVYVEKPVSHNVSEGRRIVQAARKYKRIVQTGTQSRSTQGTVDAIEYVHSGGIGDVKLARGLCYKRRKSIGNVGNYDVPASVDYNLWLGPAPDKSLNRGRFHYDWHWQWDYGNGDLGNQGIHQMDIARWGLGVDNIGDGVTSYGGRFGYVDAGETANTQVSVHTFGDKTLVFEVRGLETDGMRGDGSTNFDAPAESRLAKDGIRVGNVFYGTDGFVVLTSGYGHTFAFNPDGTLKKQFQGGGDHFANFIEAVRARDTSLLHADIEEGHLSSALCHLGNISYRLGTKVNVSTASKWAMRDSEHAHEAFGRVVDHLKDNKVDLDKTMVQYGPMLKLDGEKEVFVGDDVSAANAMLTRNYREPFVVPEEANL